MKKAAAAANKEEQKELERRKTEMIIDASVIAKPSPSQPIAVPPVEAEKDDPKAVNATKKPQAVG